MKRNANAAAEVTMMMRLRFVSRYWGMSCAKKFFYVFVFNAKSTRFFAFIVRSLKKLYKEKGAPILDAPLISHSKGYFFELVVRDSVLTMAYE